MMRMSWAIGFAPPGSVPVHTTRSAGACYMSAGASRPVPQPLAVDEEDPAHRAADPGVGHDRADPHHLGPMAAAGSHPVQGAQHEWFSRASANEIVAHGDRAQQPSAVDVVGAEPLDPLVVAGHDERALVEGAQSL